MIDELTIEITNYCPNHCKYCSSNAIDDYNEAIFLNIEDIENNLEGKQFEHIILSGGEPLAHPKFYQILELCKLHSKDVVIYSNSITHLIYNPSVIDGIYLEANLTVLPEVDKVHILRRVKQGKEKNRPEVHLSRNFSQDCNCNHKVIRPDGSIRRSACSKEDL
jgi:organic radical activating enzyme